MTLKNNILKHHFNNSFICNICNESECAAHTVYLYKTFLQCCTKQKKQQISEPKLTSLKHTGHLLHCPLHTEDK